MTAILFRILKFSPVVMIGWDISKARGPIDQEQDVRPATAADGALFDDAGFPGMLEQKLAQGPGWISVGNDGLRAWNFLDTQETQLANWLVIRTTDPATLWSVGTWVSRDHRGRGLANRIRQPAVAWCRERGCRELIGWINTTNLSSLRASHKNGYRAIAHVIFLRLGDFALVRHGRRWSLGRWTSAHPLVLSLEALRRDFGPPQPLLRPPADGAAS